MIIPENKQNGNTCLKITFNSDITEELGNCLPYPRKSFITQSEWVYYWFIDGFFGTKRGLDFLNDIKARFLLSYPNEIDKISHFPTQEEANLHLKHFQGLKSKAVAIINKTSRFDNTEDFIFWCLKLEAERLIIEHSQVRYDWLFDFAIVNFGDTSTKKCKDTSTLKSKCRSITNYYIEKGFELDKYQKKYTTPKEKEKLKMTRQEHMKKVKREQKEKTRKKIQNFLSGMFAEEYKKPNGKWNIAKISRELNISRQTLHEHFKEL